MELDKLKEFCRYAKTLSIGDEVLTQKKNELTAVKITHVSRMTIQGNYYFLKRLYLNYEIETAVYLCKIFVKLIN